jgi:putative toxin-antitoxin system antitoxin component (TIGR02293 family)
MTTRHHIAKPAAKRSVPAAGAKAAATRVAEKTAVKMTLGALTRSAKIRVFISWNKMDFADKIHLIRSGVPAKRIGELSSFMDMPKEALMESLDLSRATINHKVQLQQTLSPQESERVMGMQTLIGQVQAMIDTETTPEFDAAKWLASWLAAPLPALGGATPASFMDTVEGQKYVGNLLKMTQSGAYA